MTKGNFEPVDERTGVAEKHRAAALKGKGNKVSNAEIAPTIKFEESMFVGYTCEADFVQFMEIEMRITNEKGKNEVSMSGIEGEVMKTDDLEKRVEDYWENVDMEEDYGYMADEAVGEEPSDDDVYAKMPDDTPDPDEDEDAHNEAYDEAYEEAMDDFKDKREEYLDSLERDLKNDNHPFDVHQEEFVNSVFYTLTLEGCGQVLDRAKDHIPIIPESDLDFIVKAWENHHLFGFFENAKETNRSAPTLETMQRLMKIYKEYESNGGDNAHIKKIVDATGI